MCSQIYAHPVEGYKCFANANKSQGTYYTCCDLDTREIKYVTYIYDGYFMGYYLVQSATKVTENYLSMCSDDSIENCVWGDGDSLDRERVRDILLEEYNYKFVHESLSDGLDL